jgi:hypothetical protein
VPKVQRHTPLPPREHPLPGTKQLQCPTDDHLKQVIGTYQAIADEPSRTGLLVGRGTLVGAITFVVMMLVYPWLVRLGVNEGLFLIFHFLTAVLVHAGVLMSLMLTNWRSQASGWALLVFYGGFIVKVVLAYLLAVLTGG